MPNKEPRLSILCPVYNSVNYVRGTLDTIVNQTFQEWELILMDGGSKDGTLEVLQKYSQKDGRIRLYSEPDEGSWHAILKSLDKAAGECVCFMYISDGYANPDWLAKAMQALDEDSDLSLVWGIPYDMTEDGTLGGPHFAYSQFLKNQTKVRRWGVLKALLRRMTWQNLLKVIKRQGAYQVSTLVSVLRGEPLPQKEEWFFYWLRTGLAFPDANMIVNKSVFRKCTPPYRLGSRIVDAFADFYFNFNTYGYLSRGLLMPASYGRIHSTQITEKRQGDIQAMRIKYLKDMDNFKRELSGRKEMEFIDHQGRVVSRRSP